MGVLGGYFYWKVIQAPEVPFLVPPKQPKWPILGVLGIPKMVLHGNGWIGKNMGKTIDTNGWNLKNHWKTIDTNGSHVKKNIEKTIDYNGTLTKTISHSIVVKILPSPSSTGLDNACNIEFHNDIHHKGYSHIFIQKPTIFALNYVSTNRCRASIFMKF